MCTGLALNSKTKHLFGRNMDLEYEFGQSIVVVPRNYIWPMRFQAPMKTTYAMIGMAYVHKDVENKGVDYPLFAEAANEKGLAMAGLNFPTSAHYPAPGSVKDAFELAPYEIIQYLLANFTTTKEVEEFFKTKNVVLVNKPVAQGLPCAPLHFIVSDKNKKSIVIEPCKDGIHVYDAPLGTLTNQPTFDWHMANLGLYQNLKTKQSKEVDWNGCIIKPHGMGGFGAHGIPGDWTPASRFIRATWLKANSKTDDLNDEQLITQFFHILNSVAMVKGSVEIETKHGYADEITLYSSCIDLEKSIYHYTTYWNSQITAIDLHKENLDSDKIVSYSFSRNQAINVVNSK